MSDLFLSFSNSDRDEVDVVYDLLTCEGFDVWKFDNNVKPGESWEEAIEYALNEAKCVIVFWTKCSVRSEEVINEAYFAHKKKKLLPVLLERSVIPYRYDRLQHIDLVDWNQSPAYSGFCSMTEHIRWLLNHNPIHP